jgi:hypothetical protein
MKVSHVIDEGYLDGSILVVYFRRQRNDENGQPWKNANAVFDIQVQLGNFNQKSVNKLNENKPFSRDR